MINKRELCSLCQYPLVVCICKNIEAFSCKQNIIILQHPNESRHAKNSVRVLTLCMENLTVVQGESSKDFALLRDRVANKPAEFALLYPSDNSLAIESNLELYQKSSPSTLILIDATWRKAYKIWCVNPWLQALNAWHFDHSPQSAYHIRKASKPNSLSTLEALAYMLAKTERLNCDPLYRSFAAMQHKVFSKHYNMCE